MTLLAARKISPFDPRLRYPCTIHDTITVGIPILAILFGILFNQRGLDKLEGRVDSRFDRLEKRMDVMQTITSAS
jgi:hypothetical protein